MSGYAKEFIRELYDDSEKDSDKEYSTVTVRLPPKYGVMLKAMSNGLEFPVLTTFTDIIPKHLFDLLVSLNEDDFNEVTKALESEIFLTKGSAANRLRESNLIPEPDLDIILKIKE